jgi:tripartite-type tricarboxylate transporter receptor subunit TctC
LPNVPTLPELGLTDEGRAVLRTIASTSEIGRSIIVTPDVPSERLVALRKAFQDMLKDPDLIASCKQRHIMLDPDTVNLPEPIITKLGTLLRQ